MVDLSKKYIHRISNQSEFEEKYMGTFYHEPWVSYTDGMGKTHYNKKMDDRYLTFEILSGGTITWLGGNKSIEYTRDGVAWSGMSAGTQISVSAGDLVQFKGNNEAYGWLSDGYPAWMRFSHSNGTVFNAYGNVMSLIYGDSFIGKKDFPENSQFNFCGLFENCTGLINANRLVLPATALTPYCYGVYAGFPLTSWDDYTGMFKGCTNLVSTPELPALSLAHSCYAAMFCDCSSLAVAPKLRAMNLAPYCYQRMFQSCTSLTEAPKLRALSIPAGAYMNMFSSCTSLATAPELPGRFVPTAETIYHGYQYAYMFYYCTSLTEAPDLPETVLQEYCYTGMFYGCSSLVKAPELLAGTLEVGCYGLDMYLSVGAGMFYGCSSLNYLKCLATNFNVSSGTQKYRCYGDFLDDVAQTGTFVAHDSSVDWGNAVPQGWAIVYEN